ncbi:hypothetical protein SATMO3_56770 [Sporomusa aerivorans]
MFNPGVAMLIGILGLCMGAVLLLIFGKPLTKERSGCNKN